MKKSAERNEKALDAALKASCEAHYAAIYAERTAAEYKDAAARLVAAARDMEERRVLRQLHTESKIIQDAAAEARRATYMLMGHLECARRYSAAQKESAAYDYYHKHKNIMMIVSDQCRKWWRLPQQVTVDELREYAKKLGVQLEFSDTAVRLDNETIAVSRSRDNGFIRHAFDTP